MPGYSADVIRNRHLSTILKARNNEHRKSRASKYFSAVDNCPLRGQSFPPIDRSQLAL